MFSINDLISKYNIRRGPKAGTLAVPKNLSAAELKMLTDRKQEILAEFDRRDKEKARMKAEEEKARQEKINRIKSDKELITVEWQEGDYLSAWVVFGVAADLLQEIGLVECIGGWKYVINDKAVEALGKSFTYSQALEYMRPIREAAEAKKLAKEAERQTKFDEARRTGQPVVVRRWTEPCDDPEKECDYDVMVEYALPDGSVKVERHHTW